MLLTPPRSESQSKAVELALQFDGFLLFHEQRVGKTWIALSVVDKRKPKNLIIFCRVIGKREWEKQLKEHLKITWDMEVQIFSHDAFSRAKAKKQLRKYLKTVKRDETMVIIDEIHRIKRRGSKTSMALRQISKRYAKYRLGLTGTPMNGKQLENLWALMDFADPSVFGTFDSFANRFLQLGGFRGVQVIGYRNQGILQKLLASRSHRVTLQESRKDKYLVQVSPRYCELDEPTWDAYRSLEGGLTFELCRRKIRLSHLNTHITKCQQLAGGFLIRDRDEEGDKLEKREILPVHTQKLDLLRRIVKTHSTEKLVITAKFKHELRAIKKLCRTLGRTTKTVMGGMPYDGNFDVDIVIIQSHSGISIDLSEASIAIFYSMDYSFIVNAQMRSRTLSFTKKFVRYYYLMARGTVDEDIYEAWRTNRKVSDVILDNWRARENIQA